jgi:eukaryotic-like serine/threonine-protein kinase
MNPERWQQIEQLYHAAIERDETQRIAYLDEACAHDQDLRNEVQALLVAEQQASHFLATPAFELAARDQAQELIAQSSLLKTGQQLGHYRMLTRLGAGGMGEVWLAEDSGLHRKAALKLLPPEFTANADRIRRFKQEARAASALNHPNILTIYEIGENDELYFIATEFIEGVTVRNRLNGGKLTPREALDITLQAAHALDTAHRAGIVHRDIKPENMMLRPDGLVKVLDFGLALIATSSQAIRDQNASLQFTTEAGTVMGTPRYMSPEQARGLKVDARTDIFSLGVVLYEMIAGQAPFAGSTTAETFAALLEKSPPPLTPYLPASCGNLESVVRKALEKDRDQRYQTIQDFASDLERFKQQMQFASDETDARALLPYAEAAATQSAPPSAISNPQARTTAEQNRQTTKFLALRRRPWAAALTAGALLLGVGVYLWVGSTSWNRWLRRFSGPTTTAPFATFPGVKDFATFSPDGNQIAFVWDGGQGGQRDIYLKLIGEDTPFRLTNTPEDESRLDWSPDGKYIAAVRANGAAAVIIPALPGGAERKLRKVGAGLSWTADSKMLAFPSPRVMDGGSGAILLLSAETGEQVAQLTTPGANNFDDQPACSPDGNYVAFLRSVGSPTNREVCVVPINGGEVRQLTFDKRQIFGLTWTADSREIVYSSNRGNGGGMGLWRIAANGGTPERIPTTGQSPNYPAIARRNNRLLYAERYMDTNIYLYEGAGFAAGQTAPEKLVQVKGLLASTREDGSPAISPDGERIVFVSKRSGSEKLWICQRDGSKAQLLTHFDSVVGTPRWSPDGRWIAFDSRFGGNVDVWIISPDGGAPRNVTNAPTNEGSPSWSNDGRWLYFASERGTTFLTMWRQAINNGVPEGQPVQLTTIEGGEGYESPDGKLLYFSKWFNKPGISVVSVEGGEPTPVPELSAAGDMRYWGVMKEGVYFVNTQEKPRPVIQFYSFATRKVTTLATVEKPPQRDQPGLSFARDGRWLLYTQRDHIINDIMVMDNFR